MYKDSDLRKLIGRHEPTQREPVTPPEKSGAARASLRKTPGAVFEADPASAVSADLARVLGMLGPAELLIIGFYVSSMLGLTDKATAEELTRKAAEMLREKEAEAEAFKAEVQELEQELAQLRAKHEAVVQLPSRANALDPRSLESGYPEESASFGSHEGTPAVPGIEPE